ncbi:helix-turn-helix domain-containing protein [Mammaliicoccus sciuri]|uniref:Helix-turn-helix transcriptional regulator n=1 Tax=Mammaliicoccus sciuri TaxID=1296 RepID=A0ABT7HWM9_MAMSC|nr:helix-turn-helix transcriptional regulator [Mammaliicoccus sciuri]MDL0116494.1 helix-turn-helix transcriptional regulator [Mammaliicoccus sciuri]
MDLNKEKVGSRIKSIRLSNGYTMEEFGQLIDNANKSLVSKWERGASFPNKHRIKIICEFGKCSISYLLYGSYEELIKGLINDYFENHSELDFLDKDELISKYIQEYNTRKILLFEEVRRNMKVANEEIKTSSWDLINNRDQILYDEINNTILSDLEKLFDIYTSNTGIQRLKRFKNMSNILQTNFKDDEDALSEFLTSKLNEMYKDERIVYSLESHDIIKKDVIKFYTSLLKGKFLHVLFINLPNLIGYVHDELANVLEGISYELNFNKFDGWNNLDDETKERIFNQIDEMASLLIERELRN